MSTARENSSGLYDTTSAPGCTEPYSGAFAKSNVTVYVVDINGPQERYFLRKQRDEATRFARMNKLTLAHVHPANLCHDTMVELFGA